MASATTPHISILRLRAGIILFLLFWLPAYLLAPLVAVWLGGGNNGNSVFRLTIGIMIIQTLIGLTGLLVAGKQVVVLLKHIPRKKIPKAVWSLFWKGLSEQSSL